MPDLVECYLRCETCAVTCFRVDRHETKTGSGIFEHRIVPVEPLSDDTPPSKACPVCGTELVRAR